GAAGVGVMFVGRGVAGDAVEVMGRIGADGADRGVAWAKQVHSQRVVEVREAGECGQADGLVTAERGLALAIVTADCVPVLLAGTGGIAAIHAGWRGIADGVVTAGVEALRQAGETQDETLLAWVGPAIGACCYEVGDEVAAQVVAASGAQVVTAGPGGRPHLDLPAAVRIQLAAAGVHEAYGPPRCTQCDAAHLWSYRGQGRAAGRNYAYIWRTNSDPAAQSS
ncbi:MAG TPA: peptidoglycan editing factor PgeF, partial [Thermoanaerobaculia bacterium]|nr:peptidoglycan editing factor PgeF [Thermoanaerobaculia bacterium]